MPNQPESLLFRRSTSLASLALFILAAVAGGYIILRYLPRNGLTNENSEQTQPGPISSTPPRSARPFDGWDNPKPDLVLIVSGQLHGYMEPCGCSPEMFGGLMRRLVFMGSLRAKNWDVVPVDLGANGLPGRPHMMGIAAIKILVR